MLSARSKTTNTKHLRIPACALPVDRNRQRTRIASKVFVVAFRTTLPRFEKVDGEWVMQMVAQVPDPLETNTYSETMDANATVRAAIETTIGDLIHRCVAFLASYGLALDHARGDEHVLRYFDRASRRQIQPSRGFEAMFEEIAENPVAVTGRAAAALDAKYSLEINYGSIGRKWV